MRIATWNLQRPKNSTTPKARQLQAEMERIAADIWILTETHVELAPAPGFVGCGSVGTDRPGQPGERWAMIWTRFEVKELEASIRTVSARVALPTGQSLIVVGTVLPWRSDKRPSGLSFTAHFANAVAQQRSSWRTLLNSNPDAEMCIAGDFNQERKRPFYVGSIAGSESVAAALADVHCDWTTGDRDPLLKQSDGTRQSIDHICLSEGLARRVRNCGSWPSMSDFADRKRKLTDHFGVWVDID